MPATLLSAARARSVCALPLAPAPLPVMLPGASLLSSRRPPRLLATSTPEAPGARARAIASGLLARALGLLPRVSVPRAWARLRMTLAVRSAGALGASRDDARFRLNGLRWHHLAIAAHLHALHARAQAEGAQAVEPMFAFVLANVWGTYNALERDVLFPWLETGASEDKRVARALKGFAGERDRLERTARRVQGELRKIAVDGQSTKKTKKRRRKRSRRTVAAVDAPPPVPEEGDARRAKVPKKAGEVREADRVAGEIKELIEDAERLHRAERDILFPIIAATFSKEDQAKLTARMISSMDSGIARLQLVNYYETIKKGRHKDQLRRFQDEVPAPVRLMLPVWKRRLYDSSPLADLHPKN